MLLKIETYPSHKDLAVETSSLPEASQIKYVNLATSSHHEDGILFNVGRKNSDVRFENEKSVSRSHCALRLVSNQRVKRRRENEDNLPGDAANDDEVDCCSKTMDGLIAVLDDLGR